MKYRLKKDLPFGQYAGQEFPESNQTIAIHIPLTDTEYFEPVPEPKDKKPERWRAKEGEECYWYTGDGGRVLKARDYYTDLDSRQYSLGNYFRTKAQAEAVARAIRTLLAAIHDPEAKNTNLMTDANAAWDAVQAEAAHSAQEGEK